MVVQGAYFFEGLVVFLLFTMVAMATSGGPSLLSMVKLLSNVTLFFLLRSFDAHTSLIRIQVGETGT